MFLVFLLFLLHFTETQSTNNTCTPACLNGGTCTNGKCQCKDVFTGNDCKQLLKDHCGDIPPCKNRGICEPRLIDFFCNCTGTNFTGKLCETVDHCANKVCPRNSTCENNEKKAHCKCHGVGWTGANCETDINECNIKDICNHGKCNNTIGWFNCTCDKNYVGDRCERKVDLCKNDTCQHGATCVAEEFNYNCICPRGWTGTHCESELLCHAVPCKNNGTCRQRGLLYECTCHPGFKGTNCETDVDECTNVNCHNGTCKDYINKYECNCLSGYTGHYCDIKINQCQPDPCLNGGVCLDEANNFTCVCTKGFSGIYCEKRNDKCPYDDCHQKFDNSATCTKKCSIPECNFDNGDCSLGVTNPWQNCTIKDHCYKVFENGKCNPECNNPKCLNDGGDCKPLKNCTSDVFCLQQYNNSMCDETCNTVECGFDGNDCNDAESRVLGNLIFVVKATQQEFAKEKKIFVRTLNKLLNSHLRVEKVEVLPSNNTSSRSRRSLSGNSRLRVTTSLRNSDSCEPTCFRSADQAASFLAGKASKGSLRLPVPLISVSSTKGKKEPDPSMPLSPLWIAIMSVGIPVFALIGVIGYKRVSVQTWRPEGHQKKNTLRHEPVGQEGDEMTSLKRDSMDESLGGSCVSGSSPESVRDCAKRFKADPGWITMTPQCEQRLPIESPDCGISTASSPVENGSTTVAYHFHSTYPVEQSLHNAARYDKYDVAMKLLDFNIDINALDKDGRSALHIAVCSLSDKVFQLLVRNRKCHIDLQANDGCTPLMDGCRYSAYKMVNDLISTGAKVNLADKQGNTALHCCAKVDNSVSVQSLLKNGAKVDAQNIKGETSVFLAAREGSYRTAETLIHHFYANIILGDNMDLTPFIIARQKGHKDIVRLISECSMPSPRQTPPPVSPPTSNFSDIRPKLIGQQQTLHHQPQQYRFEQHIKPNKPKRKRPKTSNKDKIIVKPAQVSAALPFQMNASGLEYSLHPCNGQMDPLMDDIYRSINEFPPISTIQPNMLEYTNFHHPFLTPPSGYGGEHSPDLDEINPSPDLFLTPSPESYTRSPESGQSTC